MTQSNNNKKTDATNKAQNMKAKKSISALSKSIKRFETSIDEIIEMLEVAEDQVLALKRNLSDILELIDEEPKVADAA